MRPLFSCLKGNAMPRRPGIELNDAKHILCSVTVAAANIGVTQRALQDWINNHDFPIEKSKVDLKNLLAARSESMNVGKNTLSDSARKLKAEADYKSEKAKQEEMVTLQMMGELIPQEQVKDSLEMEYLDIRQKLLQLPEEVKARIYTISPEVAQDCSEVVADAVSGCLERLAKGGNSDSQTNVGEKPKRHYKKHKTSVPAPAAGNGE